MLELIDSESRSSVKSGLFVNHGVWAPGVMLMRNIRFGVKAYLICFAFLIPIAFLVYVQIARFYEEREFTSAELEGVAHMRKYVPIMSGILKTRNATRATLGGFRGEDDYVRSRKEVDDALNNFRIFIEKNGDPLILNKSLLALEKAWKDTAASQNGVGADGRTVFGSVTDTSYNVLTDISDNSKVTLDPELASYYLGATLVNSLPLLAEDVGQLWGWSTFFSGKGEVSPKDYRRYAVWESNISFHIQVAKSNLKRMASVEPEAFGRLEVGLFDAVDSYRKKMADPEKLLNEGKQKESLYSEGQAAFINLLRFYDAGLSELERLLVERQETANKKEVLLLSIASLMIGLGMYLFFCFYLVNNGGLRLISLHLREMAEGDLRRSPTKPWGKDEPAAVIVDLQKAYDSLHMLIRKVRHSARDLNGTSSEIARASLDLSSRTESAAAALEQQAATMEEIGSSVSMMAENSQSAAGLARDNAEVAQKGGAVIRDVVNVMGAINGSSQKIGDIISVIDGIAFQTNILALNAAVEAARAGEQGRGFAVVASEVRVLAQRTGAAAKEIKDLISASLVNVEKGAQVVSAAGLTMDEILNNAKKINDLLNEIAVGSREQADGVAQSVSAIQLLEQNTQQNAALVEQTSGAAGALSEQSDLLMQEIGNFRVA